MATDQLTITVTCPQCDTPIPMPTTGLTTTDGHDAVGFDTSGIRDHIAEHLPAAAVQIISNPDIWPTIFTDTRRHAQLLDWLCDHDIDPNFVPTDSTLTVEPAPDGGHLIRHTVFVAVDGKKVYPEQREQRTVPLTTPLPDPWLHAPARNAPSEQD